MSTRPSASDGKVDPVFCAQRCASQEKEHRINPKSGSTFGSEALATRRATLVNTGSNFPYDALMARFSGGSVVASPENAVSEHLGSPHREVRIIAGVPVGFSSKHSFRD